MTQLCGHRVHSHDIVGDFRGSVFRGHEYHICMSPTLSDLPWCPKHLCRRCEQAEATGITKTCLDCVEEVKQLRQEKKASREATLAKKENKRKQLIQIYLTENGVPQQVVEDIYVQLKKYRYRDFIQNKP